jgi:ribonuclease HI
MEFHIYTDGACKGNPGSGGYAYNIYDEFDNILVQSNGSERQTTNNRMELTAAIEALRFIDSKYKSIIYPHTIIIYSDSAYLVNCFNEKWIDKWMENGWKTYDKKEVLNKELWEILYQIVKKTGTTFQKVSRKDPKIKEVDKEAKSSSKKLS